MANSPSAINTWIAEVKSVSAQAYDLSQRCRKLAAKTAANGLYAEDAPQGADIVMDDVRAAFNNIVLAQVALFDNTAIGVTDRTTLAWKINGENGV